MARKQPELERDFPRSINDSHREIYCESPLPDFGYQKEIMGVMEGPMDAAIESEFDQAFSDRVRRLITSEDASEAEIAEVKELMTTQGKKVSLCDFRIPAASPLRDFNGCCMIGTDFTWIQEALGFRFSGVDLRKANFSRSELDFYNFEETDLRDARMEVADLFRVRFQRSNLNGVSFLGSKFTIIDFGDSLLDGVQGLTPEMLMQTIFSDSKGLDPNLVLATLRLLREYQQRSPLMIFQKKKIVPVKKDVSLTDSNREAADLLQRGEYRDLSYLISSMTEKPFRIEGVKLDHKLIENFLLHEADISGTTFEESTIVELMVTDSVLIDVNFSGATLNNSTFREGTILNGSSFRNAKLSNVDFTDADMRGVDFTGATFDFVNLSNVDLTGVKGLTPEMLSNSIFYNCRGLPKKLVDETLALIAKKQGVAFDGV